jgi:O-antigen ligase
MLRLALLLSVVAFISAYAWRDWFKSLCGLILLIGIIEHPDFPNSIGGIQGANPWNVALLSIVLAWATRRGREGLTWDMPHHVTALLFAYFAIVIVGWVRMMMDPTEYLATVPASYLVSELLINSVKWVIPGLLLFDGCRDERRLHLAIGAILGIYVLLAIQVIRWMPISAALQGDALQARSLKILLNEVGFHRVNLSMMLSGASWAIFACLLLVTRRLHRAIVVGLGLAAVYGQALTAGRTGYITWALVGLVLCVLRWRKYLVLMPVVALLVTWAVPGAIERLSQGFGDSEVDRYVVTAGRNIAWPMVIEKIEESPVVGHARMAMVRTGLTWKLHHEFGEDFPHPHNAYLELLLDNGLVGFVPVVAFYLLVVGSAVSLLRERGNPNLVVTGAITLSLVLALLFASMGSQTFYPREGATGMWCAIGLMFRARVARQRARAGAPAAVAPPSAEEPGEPIPLAPLAGRAGAGAWWRPSAGASSPPAATSLWRRV